MPPARRAAKAVVIVLDDFDLFARRSKQTLLYTLLDCMQHTRVQVRRRTLRVPPRRKTRTFA